MTDEYTELLSATNLLWIAAGDFRRDTQRYSFVGAQANIDELKAILEKVEKSLAAMNSLGFIDSVSPQIVQTNQVTDEYESNPVRQPQPTAN